MEDKRKNNGGSRPNSGPKPLPAGDKKVTLNLYVKGKHLAAARRMCEPIINKLNNKP